MPKYRKKPVVIEAVQWTGSEDDLPAVLALVDFDSRPSDGVHVKAGIGFTPPLGTLDIPTLEGTMTAQSGDWIIKGVAGEVYRCKPDIFAATYEEVGAASVTASTAADRSCAKCASDDIHVRWHGAGGSHLSRRYEPCASFARDWGKPKEEHLHYTCRRCQYAWTGPVAS